MDGLSNLPNEVLCHILSFLTTKEAALTSVLSKRWLNLWILVPNLDIDDSVFVHPEFGKRERDGIIECFMDFVDKVLTLQGDSPIKKFSLKCETGIDTNRVNRWICNVLQRGVSRLELVLDFPRWDMEKELYRLPEELFVSKTLVELKLRSKYGIDWWNESECNFLPMLKTLDIDSVWVIILCDPFEMFSSCFPVLEELHLAGMEWSDIHEIASSASLKKLTIYASYEYVYADFLAPKSISFDAPSLVYFEYCDCVAADYPKVNLMSVVEAQLKLKVTENEVKLMRARNVEDDVVLRLSNVWKLMNGMRNVQKLFLSADTLEVLSLCCESIPVFDKLKFLRIKSDKERGWQAMPALLRNCSHLETLVFEGILHCKTNKCGDACNCISRKDKRRSLSSCRVKKMQINGFRGTFREMEMIKHFLESFRWLKEMKIYVVENNPTRLARELLSGYDKYISCTVQFLV
ncbi:F-box/LRR-repeat protein [Cardamine amara subsp. amara]|uniref:F-box/LRR-repeat protein n=1 Tax=Cardamine amara subsp. amara TaxID=228776 RepID=A0ABD0ZXZ7_CARAN